MTRSLATCGRGAEQPAGISERLEGGPHGGVGGSPAGEHLLGQRRPVIRRVVLVPDDRQDPVEPFFPERRGTPQAGQRSTDDDDALRPGLTGHRRPALPEPGRPPLPESQRPSRSPGPGKRPRPAAPPGAGRRTGWAGTSALPRRSAGTCRAPGKHTGRTPGTPPGRLQLAWSPPNREPVWLGH